MRRSRPTRLGRFLRGRRPDRNPLRRPADRVETAMLAVLIAGFCAGAPLLANTAITTTHSEAIRQMQAQHVNYHQVRATLLEAAVSTNTYPAMTYPEADARWVAPDGRTVTGVVPAPPNARDGSTVLIWTDSSGNQVTPLEPGTVTARETIAVAGAVTGLAGIELVTGGIALAALNRRRMNAWDADWQATEPRWTSRR